ncbi:MAG: acyl-CoA desaturase [Pseudomonadota bacterium]
MKTLHPALPSGLSLLRARAVDPNDVLIGQVRYSPAKSLWFTGMAAAALAGGAATASLAAILLFMISTFVVLLLGYSLGYHRKLIHNSYSCPKWLEYLLMYLGVQVGLAGPLGLLRQHDLRDFAQRHARCHPYLRHGAGILTDFWWPLHCQLDLANAPSVEIESGIADDRFYRFLERTWMLQQVPVALLFYLWGGWAFVFWGVCARVLAGALGQWLLGYFAHNHGEVHIEVGGAAVQGRNLHFVSLVSMGESWHNNHHAFPGSARFALEPGQWDPGWGTLCLMARAGLVWDMVLPEHLPARPELERGRRLTVSRLSVRNHL